MDANSKARLEQAVSEWFRYKLEIKAVKAELEKKKSEQAIATQTIIDVVNQNNIDEFSTRSGGTIAYKKRTNKKPISKKLLTTILPKFFQNDEIKVADLLAFINENQETVVKETIDYKEKEKEKSLSLP